MPHSTQEIERKWLLTRAPTDLNILERHIVHQSYIAAKDDIEIRLVVRYDFDAYDNENGPVVNKRKLTIKKGNGLVRDEAEINLTEKQLDKLLPHAEHDSPIVKVFSIFEIPGYPDLTLHFSEVDPGSETSFFYAEVEFPTKEEAAAFTMPTDIAVYVEREVTGENTWQMKNYWRRTRMDKCDLPCGRRAAVAVPEV